MKAVWLIIRLASVALASCLLYSKAKTHPFDQGLIGYLVLAPVVLVGAYSIATFSRPSSLPHPKSFIWLLVVGSVMDYIFAFTSPDPVRHFTYFCVLGIMFIIMPMNFQKFYEYDKERRANLASSRK
jgi:hypothetical protein